MRRAAGCLLLVAGLFLAAVVPALPLFRPLYAPVPIGNIIQPAGWLLLVAGVALLVPKRYRW